MMKETPPTLTLEATTFNKPQLQEQLSVLEQRQEAQIALAGPPRRRTVAWGHFSLRDV